VKHEMKVVGEEGVKEVVLDTRDLEVGKVEVEGVEVKVSCLLRFLGSGFERWLSEGWGG